jgi:histidinol-phosphatase
MTDVDRDLLDQAVGFARAAGEMTLGWFNHAELTVDAKTDGTPVTQADKAAERMLRELISAAHPEDSIIGEEEDDLEGRSGRRWVIDPIDGTKAFTHGVATYSNLLYLEDEHGPAIGIINLPALGETVYAARGLGCFLDGTPVRVSQRDQIEGSYLCCTGFHEWTPGMFERVGAAGIELRTWGDAYGYALVASGRVEAMFDPVLAWWDVAALTVIIPESGGTLTSWEGSSELAGPTEGLYSAIASNGRFHEEVTSILRP